MQLHPWIDKGLQVSIMISRNHINLFSPPSKRIEEVGDLTPLGISNEGDIVFDVSKKNETIRFNTLNYLNKRGKNLRSLTWNVDTLIRKRLLITNMELGSNQSRQPTSLNNQSSLLRIETEENHPYTFRL